MDVPPEHDDAAARSESGADGGVVTLNLSGSVDDAVVATTTRLARDLLRRPGVHTLAVDMGAVTLVDSSGLGLLVNLNQLAQDRGAQFSMHNVPARVSQLLELTGLLAYLSPE